MCLNISMVSTILLVLLYNIALACYVGYSSSYDMLVEDDVAKFIRYVFNDRVVDMNITVMDSPNGVAVGGIVYGYRGGYIVRFTYSEQPPTYIRLMGRQCNIRFNNSEAHIWIAWNVYAAAVSLYGYNVFENVSMLLQQILWEAFNEENYSYSNVLLINDVEYEMLVYSSTPSATPRLKGVYSREMLVIATKTYHNGTRVVYRIGYSYTSLNGVGGEIQVEISKGVIMLSNPPGEIEEGKRKLLLNTLTMIVLVAIIAIAVYMLVSVKLIQREQL